MAYDNDKVNEELTKLENEKLAIVEEQKKNEDLIQKAESEKQIYVGLKRKGDIELIRINTLIGQLRRNFKIEGYKTSKLRKLEKIKKDQIIISQRGKCAECNSTQSLSVHHKTPLSHGGTDAADNLLVLCIPCHGKKHRI